MINNNSHVSFKHASMIIDEQVSKLTAMACWGKDLVWATERGHLIVYEIENQAHHHDEGQKFGVLKQVHRDFAKKPITQLHFEEEDKIMICLSDGFLSVHSLPNLEKVKLNEKIEKIKNCVKFTVDRSEGILKLAACLRKKLVVCEWTGSDLNVKKELFVPDTVKICLFCGQSLCIGFRGEYNLIDLSNGSMQMLFFTGAAKTTPVGTALSDKQILLGRDNISVFLGYDGKPTKKFGLTWSESPVQIEYAFPYIIAVLTKTVETQLVFGGLQQVLQIPGAQFLSVSSDGSIFIANKVKNWTVYKLTPVDFINQLEILESRGLYSEAKILCENLDQEHVPDREKRLQRLQLLNAYQSFNQGHYGRAMDSFFSLHVDPLQVIALYNDFLPPKVRAKYSFPIDMEDLGTGATFNKAVIALANYLELKRKELKLSEILIKKAEISASIGRNTSQGYGKNVSDVDAEVGGSVQVEWNNTTAIGQLVDTTLLRCYAKIDGPVKDLLTIPNFCHVEECEAILWTAQRFKDLVELYRSRELHHKALKLLQDLGQSNRRDLTGPSHSISYMKNLGKSELDLILEFSPWVLMRDPVRAMNIFLKIATPEKQLPPARILAHLESISQKDPKAFPTDYVVKYLEFLINELNDKTRDFHNKLAHYYFDRVLRMKEQAEKDNPEIKYMVAGTEPGDLGRARAKLLDFLEESQYFIPPVLLANYDLSKIGLHEEKAILFSKIGKHEDSLKEYVHTLQDFTMAEKYCEQHFDPEDSEKRDVYLLLLKVYITPYISTDPATIERFKKAALDLLNRHYKNIDPIKALAILPEHTPLYLLDTYLEKILREINQEKRNKQIISNIQKCETMKIKSELVELRSRVVRITDDTLCPICSRRIGDTAFAYYPNGTVIHYLCYKKLEDKFVCPVTGERFDPDV